jgi:hypothetical protein
MKRVSPNYRNKSFEELHPEYSAQNEDDEPEEEIDSRWSALKNIKFN